MVWIKVDTESQKSFTRAQGKVIILSEEVINDSDKTLTYDTDLAEGQRLEIMAIRIEYVATATVGTRMIEIRVKDSAGDVIQVMEFSATIAASDTENYEAAEGMPERVGTNINYETLTPGLVLLPAQSLQILDASATDAAADDMTVHVTGRIF